LDDIYTAWIVYWHVTAWWTVFTLAYHVCLSGCLVCGSSLFVMIINLLM